MTERRESGGKWSPGAVRFRAVMKATKRPHETGTQWAHRMGLGPTAVSNFRNGIPISKEAAKKIAAQTGVTTDYLFSGDDRYLSVEMSKLIEEAMERPGERPDKASSLARKGQNIDP